MKKWAHSLGSATMAWELGYGDAIDPTGKVVARAWCEAVVQRLPDYSDSADEPHLKQADLKSGSNKIFGRIFDIVRFRWLHPDEI